MARELQGRGIGLAVLVLAAAMAAMAPSASADFYLRAGVGLEWVDDTVFEDRYCGSETPTALYGCGSGGDGAPTRTTGHFDAGAAFELAFGHEPVPGMRVETRFGYLPSLRFQGTANLLEPGREQSVTADVSALSAMVAGYGDLPLALGHGSIVPFLGAGAGVAQLRIGTTRMTFPQTYTEVPGATRTALAWMVTVGLSAAVSKRTAVEFAWCYTDFGEVRTGRGAGQVVWHDGSKPPIPLDIAETRARLSDHGIRLSLRYGF